jgi:hypothetical protein
VGFLSDIVNDAKPRPALPLRVASGVSASTTVEAPVPLAGAETTPDEIAPLQVQSKDSAEGPIVRLFEGATARQSPVPTGQPTPSYRKSRAPETDAANEPFAPSVPEVHTRDAGDAPIGNGGRGRPPTPYSERSTSHRQVKNVPTGVTVPAPSITGNAFGDEAQPGMMEEPVFDPIRKSSKPDGNTHAPLPIRSRQSPRPEQTQRRMIEEPASDAIGKSSEADVNTPTPVSIRNKQSPLPEQTQRRSMQQHEIDRERMETRASRPAHHSVFASTPSVPRLTGEEMAFSERAAPPSSSSPVSRPDSAPRDAPLPIRKPIETGFPAVQVTPSGRSCPPPPEREPEPTVQIGKIDILVGAPENARPQRDSPPKPRNIASRRYLRRL